MKLSPQIKDFISEYWVGFACLIICLLVAYFFAGCEPRTSSLLDPQRKVNRSTLTSEVQLLMTEYENRVSDLDRQAELRNFVIQQTLVVAESGTINPVGLVTALSGILGIGFATDDIRLRKERKKRIANEPVDTN